MKLIPWLIDTGLLLMGFGAGLRCAWFTATSELWLIVLVAGCVTVVGAEIAWVRVTGNLSE